ncbi:glycosyltransferase [Candidatus Woesearchaeota archaeon]|nr:glycosyltransferase [Candidatus Woesearchaeota archaeon]
MRIAIFTDTFLPNIDGVVTATLNMAKGLADRGHDITIVAPVFRKRHPFSYKNIKVIRNRSMPSLFHPEYRTTMPLDPLSIAQLRKRKIELVHIQTPWTIGMQGVSFAKIMRLPLTGTFHTYHAEPDYLKNLNMDYPLIHKMIWDIEIFYYNMCDFITCPSEFTKKELIDHGCKKPVQYVSNGIDPSTFDVEHTAAIRKKYAHNADHLLLSVGRIAVEKNISHLLQAMRLIVDRLPRTNLLLIGDGLYMKKAKALAKELNLDKHIIFTGYIPHAKLKSSGIYNAADAFVITSKTETGPITVLEAQANGKPCIGVKAKNLPYLIENNVDGFVVDPDDAQAFCDATVKVLTDKKLYNRLSEQSKEAVKKHYLPNVITTWEEIYEKAIREKQK